MVETRSQAQGQPLKQPGAYNTDTYYQELEKKEGDTYGDLAINQERDAGDLDNPADRDYTVTAEEDREATKVAQEELPAEDTRDVQGEAQDLKDTPSGPEALDRQGEPVPIVEGGFDDEENYPGQAA